MTQQHGAGTIRPHGSSDSCTGARNRVHRLWCCGGADSSLIDGSMSPESRNPQPNRLSPRAVLLGLIGAMVGVLLGVLLAWIISAIGISMPPPPNADIGYTAQIRLVPSVVAGAFAIGLFATVFAAIVPALRVARTEVVDALRQNV